jgi:hypothetical protein
MYMSVGKSDIDIIVDMFQTFVKIVMDNMPLQDIPHL